MPVEEHDCQADPICRRNLLNRLYRSQLDGGSMKEYGKTCEKCGEARSTAKLVWHEGSGPGTPSPQPEHLSARCGRCGYWWVEHPQDAPTKIVKQAD